MHEYNSLNTVWQFNFYFMVLKFQKFTVTIFSVFFIVHFCEEYVEHIQLLPKLLKNPNS